jgi:hypothetical protein
MFKLVRISSSPLPTFVLTFERRASDAETDAAKAWSMFTALGLLFPARRTCRPDAPVAGGPRTSESWDRNFHRGHFLGL